MGGGFILLYSGYLQQGMFSEWFFNTVMEGVKQQRLLISPDCFCTHKEKISYYDHPGVSSKSPQKTAACLPMRLLYVSIQPRLHPTC